MKKILALCLVLTMCLSLLSGCGNKDTDTKDTSNNDTQQKQENVTDNKTEEPTGTVVNGETIDEDQYLSYLQSEPSILDVARFTVVYDRECFYNFLEPLTRINDGKVIPAGAESWDISEDGKTYTFHLRENYWSDGQKVTANDYVSTIQRQADPTNAFVFVDDMSIIKNFTEVNTGTVDKSELGVKVIDDNTFTIELNNNTPDFLANIDFFPEREDMVAKYGDSYGTEAESIVSCGPFKLTDWVHGSKLVYEKNDKYWNADNVYLTKITANVMTETTTQLASFENGTLDYLSVSDADYIAKFEKDSNMTNEDLSVARTTMFVINCKDDLFSNEKVRLAFSLAIDRDTICEELSNGIPKPAYGLIPYDCSVGDLNYRENVEEPLLELVDKYPDPKQLLLEGMKELNLGDDPSTLTVKVSFGSTSASTRESGEFYQQMWQEALGVNIELVFNDTAIHNTNIREGNYQLAMTSWGANLEPLFQLSRWTKGGQSKWINEEYADLVNDGQFILDENERLKNYADAEKLLIQQAAIAPVNYRGQLRFAYKYIRNLKVNPFDTMGLQLVYTVGRK